MREWRYFPLVLLNIVTQRRVDHFLAVSNTVKEFYEHWGLKKGRASVIYNGIELKGMSDEKGKNYVPLSAQDVPILGYVAKLRKERNHLLLFQAFHILKKHNTRVHLILVGDGHYHSVLKKAAIQLMIQDDITFFGYRSNAPTLLKQFTIYVHPSLYEGMSNALLEAMAAGCPIITTDIPENRELIQNRIHGLLVPPKNPEAMAEAIQYALNNPQKMRQFGDNARQRAQKTFSIDRTTTQLTQLLNKYVGSE